MKLLAVLLASAFGVGAAIQTRSPLPPAMASLVETERAFARTSVAQGRRAAFLAFFAENALFFTPEPTNAPARIRAWPAAGPFNLDWEPRFGDVSRAGDLGYTTGPFVRTSPDADARVLGTGWYFTIWKLQPDVTWKVLIDAGITAPAAGALRPAAFEMAVRAASPARQASASPLVADRVLCESIGRTSVVGAVASVSTNQTRLYREGLSPIVGLGAIRSHLGSKPGAMTCSPVKDEMSRSGDLGYTYGTYMAGQGSVESGYYLRVWKRVAGQWRLAVDLLIPRA
jgi:ketosteroid isomerase-like protein